MSPARRPSRPAAPADEWADDETPAQRPSRAEAAAQVVRQFPGAKVVQGGPDAVSEAAPDDVAGDYDVADPYSLPDLAAGLVVPEGRASGDDLVDRLLCLRPLRAVEVSTEYGEKLATETYVVEVDEAGEHVDHGKIPFLWQYVRKELAKATSEAPWVVGRIVKRKTAYFLNPPSPQEAKDARVALRAFLEERAAERAAERGDHG